MNLSLFDDDRPAPQYPGYDRSYYGYTGPGGTGLRAPSILPGGGINLTFPGGLNTPLVTATAEPLPTVPTTQQPTIGQPGWSLFGPDGRIFGLPPLVVIGGAAVALYMFSGKK